MKDKEQFLDGVLVSTMKLEAEKTWRIRELENIIEDLLEAIPKQDSDLDWWPDELVAAVRNAKASLEPKLPSPTPPAPAATGIPNLCTLHGRGFAVGVQQGCRECKDLAAPEAMSDEPEITVGSGNVFADLGFPNADELKEQARELALATSDEEIWVGSREWYAREELRKANEAAEKIKGLVPPFVAPPAVGEKHKFIEEAGDSYCAVCGGNDISPCHLEAAVGETQQVELLGAALGKVLVRLGVVRDIPLTGPELLMAADAYIESQPPAVGETAQTYEQWLEIQWPDEDDRRHESHVHGSKMALAYRAATAIYQKALGEKEAEFRKWEELVAEKNTALIEIAEINHGFAKELAAKGKRLEAAEAELKVVKAMLAEAAEEIKDCGSDYHHPQNSDVYRRARAALESREVQLQAQGTFNEGVEAAAKHAAVTAVFGYAPNYTIRTYSCEQNSLTPLADSIRALKRPQAAQEEEG